MSEKKIDGSINEKPLTLFEIGKKKPKNLGNEKKKSFK